MSVESKIFIGLAKAGFDLRFRVARMTRIELVGRLIDRMFFDEDRRIYLSKDDLVARDYEKSVDVQVDKTFEMTNIVLPSQILDHFIMDFCLCKDANACRDYPKHLGCLFLGKGVLKIDKKYGRLVTVDEALEHMRKRREAGLMHLIGRSKIDAVAFDSRRKEDLMSICSCHPCCCLWKMLPDLNKDISGGVARMPGVAVSVSDLCTGCGACVENRICFVGALSLKNGKARIDDARCRGCGRCVEFCPESAIELTIEDPGYFEKSVKNIEPLVDITAK